MDSARNLKRRFLGLLGLTRHPRLDITLTPTLPSDHSNGSLSVRFVIEKPNIAANALLLSLPTLIGNVPSNNFRIRSNDDDDDEQAPIVIEDAQGQLPFVIEDSGSPPERHWLPERDTEGDVIVSFTAHPRHVDTSTPVGPRVDLRENFGGLIGSGLSFFPLLPTTITYDIHLTWNLSLVPDGTHAVCSFGEGTEVNIKAPAQTLTRTVYAVGPIHSVADDKFGMYWFGSPPFNVTSLASTVKNLFDHMAPFFNDKTANYRIFIRHSPRGYGGTAFDQSFILEYDDESVQRVSSTSLFGLLAHEMVHNWIILEPTPEADDVNEGLNAWYAEGLAHYYSMILPYKFGLYTERDLLEIANSRATGYYTSPVLHLNNSLASKLTWEDQHAGRLSYYRGCFYFINLNHQIVQKSDGRRTLDNLVFPILRARKKRKYHGINLWHSLLRKELGQKGIDEYHAMLDGTLIVPAPNALHPKLTLIRQDAEPYDLGFAPASINDRVVSGLDPNSRAAQAGLRDGDEILNNFSTWDTTDEIDKEIVVKVKRDGEVLDIKYWPRGFQKAKAYKWTEA